MFKKIVQHMKDVERAVNGMRANAAFAFALACTERQWPVFQLTAGSVPWMVDWQSKLRHDLDAAWQHVLDDTSLSVAESIAPFQQLLISSGASEPEVEDIGGPSSAVAHTIANSIVDLLDAVERRDVGCAHRLSCRNFDLLELLLDEHGVLLNNLKEGSDHDPSEIAAVRDLIEQELQQQNRDVQALGKDSSAAGIEEVRRTSVGKSLFGQVRCPEAPQRAAHSSVSPQPGDPAP
jgi:hypothetical protein